PGRTQTINFYNIDERFYLVDLPGYGYAKTSRENRTVFAEMLGEYLTNTLQLKLVLLIVDARLGPTDFDQEMIAYLRSLDLPFVMIVNKIDKLTRAQGIDQLRKLSKLYPDIQLIPHSSVEGGRREVIWQVIEAAIRDTQVD
ncbi:MAG: 50S ribosome-binding GTPase, partial [Candidatus Uhrbacteria bacterium]|nr:50S ribosome-binding GTPase [Candidatus Uhrbacteria bacterium]